MVHLGWLSGALGEWAHKLARGTGYARGQMRLPNTTLWTPKDWKIREKSTWSLSTSGVC